MFTSRYLALFVTAAVFLGSSASSARAQTLIGIDNTDLFTIDTATGATKVIGTKVFPGVTLGMDFRAGKLYTLPEFSGSLYEIDPATAATIGAPIAIAGKGPWLEGDLAFRSDGVAFLSDDGGGLWSFDLSQPVPAFNLINGATPSLDGLAFNAAGVLYGLANGGDQLYTIDTVTGVATKVGPGTGFAGGGINVAGLAFDSTGKLYGLHSLPLPSRLFSIDPVTGLGTFIANPTKGVRAMRFMPGGPPPSPPVAGGGIAEGNYPGSKGLANGAGGEGTFGFGRQTRMLHPFLKGPHRDPQGALRVFNDAHRQQVQATDGESGLGVIGWGLLLLSVRAPAVLVFGRRRGA